MYLAFNIFQLLNDLGISVGFFCIRATVLKMWENGMLVNDYIFVKVMDLFRINMAC